ncbi:MAG TPA: ribonuclease J, partial [Parcubacteria group bacterium]|nr:ribonuclease J [Parcubacteria group bacterium]
MNNQSNFKRGLRGKNMHRRNDRPIAEKRAPDILPPLAPGNIRIVPLGGVEEIGRNMMAIEYGNDIIVVDCGIQFTDAETPGVDYILPNVKYLEERKGNIRAMVITHGHLDHIGGIPYIMNRIGNPPIYTREFGALLIKKRQEEFPHMPPLDLRIVDQSDKSIAITPNLKVRFFGLTHSIPDSTGVIIETPLGDIVNTGDVRVDNENGVPTDKEVEQYKMFKDRNVLLFTMDSTGIEKPGFSPSEDFILKNIDSIVANVPGRVIIATFASQVERIIEFMRIAKRYGKKVVIEGRSMRNNVDIIKHLNLVELDHIVPIEDIEKYPPNKIMMIATGAQGEEFAALMRMSNKTHKFIKLQRSDTVILSSSVIPGNERAIAKLKDNLFRHDAKIITYLDSDVHTSGHGKRGELEWVHKQIPYKFFMPVHGHHYMLKMHAELARQLGAAPENVIVADNGSLIEIREEGKIITRAVEKAPSEDMVVEGFSVGDVSEVLIRDRKMLAEEGFVVVVAMVVTKTGKLRKSPDIISRGFIYLRDNQELLTETRHIIKRAIESTTVGMNPINFDYAKNAVSEDVARFLFQKTMKKPVIIPVIL